MDNVAVAGDESQNLLATSGSHFDFGDAIPALPGSG
jgi:hypothetical protein